MAKRQKRTYCTLAPEESKLVAQWLKEQRTESTKIVYQINLDNFRAWYKKPLTEFLKLTPQQMRRVALDFQDGMHKHGIKPNTIISFLTALGSFCTWNGKTLMLKNERLAIQTDTSSHIFNIGDLTRMFDVANVEQKAILATFVSLGWEVNAILNLDLKFVKTLIGRAKKEDKKFIYFQSSRNKTGARGIGVLNPLALEWLEEWLKDPKAKGPRLFSYTTINGVNSMMRHLARDAHITKLGRIHTHSLRKWVMSGLSRGKLNQFQIKYMLGKAIPPSGATYVQTLQEIEEYYPEVYEKYLNIRPGKIVTVIDQAKTIMIEEQAREIAELRAGNARIAGSKKTIETLLKRVEKLEKRIGNKT